MLAPAVSGMSCPGRCDDAVARRVARYREPVEKAWPGYLEGRRTLSEAARELLGSLPPEERR